MNEILMVCVDCDYEFFDKGDTDHCPDCGSEYIRDYDAIDDYFDDDMDGDWDSAMASAGFGTDEDYGYYGEDY